MPAATRTAPPPASIFPEPQSFFWLPIAGQRHAAGIGDREVPYGELVGTLCEQQMTRAPVTDLERLAHLPGMLVGHGGARRSAGMNLNRRGSRHDSRIVIN